MSLLAEEEIHLAKSPDAPVTSRSTSAERMRALRARELMYERQDWQLFLDPVTLSQKAGCDSRNIGKIVLKEVVDNALDAGAQIRSFCYAKGTWTISDDGPGIDPEDVPRLFAVNRPLLSSKLKRLPLRGMLGNGLRVVMGAVAAFDGKISVATRGHYLTLRVDKVTGYTVVVKDEPIECPLGLTVHLTIKSLDEKDASLAYDTINVTGHGKGYEGPSSPWWYGPRDLERLFSHVLPETATVTDVCRDLGLDHQDSRAARQMSRKQIETVLETLRSKYSPVDPRDLGPLGPYAMDCVGYAVKDGIRKTQSGAVLPYIVEAWATCSKRVEKGQADADFFLFLNRSRTLSSLVGSYYSQEIHIKGCGLIRSIKSPGPALYEVGISVICPSIQILTDGKDPELHVFGEAIAEVVRKACGHAYRTLDKPAKNMSITEAAAAVLVGAYLHASGGGKLPANARQVMYAARPRILEMTGRDPNKFDDNYFIQKVMRDWILDHPNETENWDLVFDARGHFTELHTGISVPLGTIDVRNYLHARPKTLGDAVTLEDQSLYPTHGPEHRYSSVLFIEKEGFDELFTAVQLSERYDIGIMSTKGLSVGAARRLVDGLAARGVNIFVLHDLDISGFKIYGTLGTDSRVYTFQNDVEVIDLGLRLEDVQELGLKAEPVNIEGDWHKYAATLRRHGATEEEIEFLRFKRVELNMMTAPEFVTFVERKLADQGVKKVVPSIEIVQIQALRLIEHSLAKQLVAKSREDIRKQAGSIASRSDLIERIIKAITEDPSLSWDLALANIMDDL